MNLPFTCQGLHEDLAHAFQTCLDARGIRTRISCQPEVMELALGGLLRSVGGVVNYSVLDRSLRDAISDGGARKTPTGWSNQTWTSMYFSKGRFW